MSIQYAVFGGELADPAESRFRDPSKVEFVGVFPTRDAARDAWKARAWMTVDNALMRFFIEEWDPANLPPVAAPDRVITGKERRVAAAIRASGDLGAIARLDAREKFDELMRTQPVYHLRGSAS